MALVACTQLKELGLRYTDLRGEWFVVGIDRGPVPSEQRMERALYNTPEFFIFDTNFVFWVCAVRKFLSLSYSVVFTIPRESVLKMPEQPPRIFFGYFPICKPITP